MARNSNGKVWIYICKYYWAKSSRHWLFFV